MPDMISSSVTSSSPLIRNTRSPLPPFRPLVSVIILTYNQADTIAAAIESVLDQDCDFPYEIIIGDDASTDSTRAICEEYAARYNEMIRLMPKAPNKGIVGNYFDCLDACHGSYITDCAGDDCWIDRSKLQYMADILDADHSLAVVFSDWEIFNVKTGRSSLRSALPGFPPSGLEPILPSSKLSSYPVTGRIGGPKLMRLILNHTSDLPFNLSASLYRRSALAEVMKRSPEMVRNPDFGCEDLPIECALASQGDAAYYPFPTLCYRVAPTSVTNTDDTDKLLRFHAKTLHASAVICRFYGVEQKAVFDMMDKKIRYIIALASKSAARDLRSYTHRIRGLRKLAIADLAIREWSIRLSLRTYLRVLVSPLRLRLVMRRLMGSKSVTTS